MQNHLIYRQIGPPPPATASPGLHMQYALLRRMRVRSHIIDVLNSLIETVAMLTVKVRALALSPFFLSISLLFCLPERC